MKLTPIAQAAGNTVPRPLNSQPPAEPVIFTAEEARRGYAMRGNTQHYCCYGMYCEAGHTSDCRYASGVAVPRGPLEQAAAGMQALDDGHDPLCMAVLRGKACTCGVQEPQPSRKEP